MQFSILNISTDLQLYILKQVRKMRLAKNMFAKNQTFENTLTKNLKISDLFILQGGMIPEAL